MPKLTIDHREIEVPQGTKVLEAAERLGIMIPRFCYHAALGSVGACRVCGVMFLDGPVKGVEMSCMTDAQDGMVVSTDHPEAQAFRKYVIEWLMLHHPLDCPVCDEGGHCLLQDETVSGGHGIRRYQGPKRTYYDQYLGIFVQHEMNRCIQCWRCRRFYQDFTGYRDLGAMQIGNRIYFGRYQDGPLESPFSGNLIDICPTGVYTDKPARFKGRRWDFERSPTLCLHCSLGCNATGSARYREMMRLEARLNQAVNRYFICDRGRFGFFYVNVPDRPRKARIGDQEVSWGESVKAAADRLGRIIQDSGPAAVACLGSARSSLETQGGLMLFCRVLGWQAPAFFVNPGLEDKVKTAVSRLDARLAVSMRDIEKADFVLVLGADPVNEAPMLALALRQAWRAQGTVAVLDPRPVFLPFEFEHLPLKPAELEPACRALVKGAIDSDAAGKLDAQARKFFEALPEDYTGAGENPGEHLHAIAAGLARSRRPVMVCGTDIVPETTPGLAADLTLLLRAAGKEAGLFYLLPGPNAFGAGLLSLPPAAEEGETGAQDTPRAAADFSALLESMESGDLKALILAEADPFWSFPDRERLARALEKLELLLVLDYLPSPAAKKAHVFLPTLAVFERTGSSFINQEGRLQWASPVHFGGIPIAQISPDQHPPRTFLNYVPGGDPKTGGETLAELAGALGRHLPFSGPDLWDWLARNQNPVLGRAGEATGHPEGLRLVPEEQTSRDFSASPAGGQSPAGALELLLVDATFGAEELASYSTFIQQVEERPQLTLHTRDAERLGLASGDLVSLDLPGGALIVALQVTGNQAPGVAVLPRHRRLEWRKLASWPLLLADGAIRKAEGVTP